MFSKKNADIKKSTSKIQDVRKDLTTRVKHLKVILDNVDISDAKGFFEANFSHIYHILYETFVLAETNLRQRVHKVHKEELETALWILEQVLCLLPELIHKRWQIHSLSRILAKLLHPGNNVKIRKQAIKYFLMWYQALNDNSPEEVHRMFASIVPGFAQESVFTPPHGGASVFHDTNSQNPVSPCELLPILPTPGPDQPGKLYLEVVLEQMVNTVVKLEWHDKSSHHHKSFHFLLESFKVYYLPKLFPSFSVDTSLYIPNLDLPALRVIEADSELLTCRVVFIKWVTSYTHQIKKIENVSQTSSDVQVQQSQEEDNSGSGGGGDSSHPSLDSNVSTLTAKADSDEELGAQIVRDVFWLSRDNVNFIHEIYRQAFLLNFNYAIAIRKTISIYKDLIQMNHNDPPPYLLEPTDEATRYQEDAFIERPVRLRNDSYLGAIHKENLLVRAGLQNMLLLFITHASNVFLLEVNHQYPTLIEEQTDVCKRVLNIYRYMVMNTRMDNPTWEQLLLVLLQITSVVLGDKRKKTYTLGAKLAPAIFQTLIVTWIKANLNVMISRELWDRFLGVLVSLTNWEELIKEWAKTLDTLTRVLARQVYNLDLTNLPLDRLSEQKCKKSRKSVNKLESQYSSSETSHVPLNRQDSSTLNAPKSPKATISRSYSETNLLKRKAAASKKETIQRRSHSLDNVRQPSTESADVTRSPSPAPSSGIETTSIKDAPVPLDVIVSDSSVQDSTGEQQGVICGGSVRGWLPNVSVILWRRMLGALGDVNQIPDAKLHAQVFEYLVKLVDTLIKMKLNQGVSPDNQSTPQPPELIPPLTLLLPWCFEALHLPSDYETGKISALRLLCSVTVHCDTPHLDYLPHFYRSLHVALSGTVKSATHMSLRFLGPRFLTLQLQGSVLLTWDLIHACNAVLNSSDVSTSTPRTAAISILSGLLRMSDDLSKISVLKPNGGIQLTTCPDGLKEHVITILLKAGKREPTGVARSVALTALGHFIYRELMNQTYHPNVIDAMNILLQALKFNNKTLALLASNTLFLLCDHAMILWSQYPRLADSVIRSLCNALFLHASSKAIVRESDKALNIAMLLCLGEWCMHLGVSRLSEISEYGENRGTCLLLLVFNVLHKMAKGGPYDDQISTGSLPQMHEDFEFNLSVDNLNGISASGIPKSHTFQQEVTLCAKSVLTHLVIHLGHFPMAIGATRLSSLVVEHDDVPNINSDELSVDIFSSPNIQLFVLTPSVITSFIELPTLDLPGGGVTAGLSTASKQVRVLLRDISGKASWDASILYCNPEKYSYYEKQSSNDDCAATDSYSAWGPMSFIQPESYMPTNMQPNLQQRAMRHRSPNVLPHVSNAAPDLDQLDDMLQYLGFTSPECLEFMDCKLNEPTMSPISMDLEAEAIGSVISERNIELEQTRLLQNVDSMLGQPASRPISRSSESYSDQDSFHQGSSSTSEQGAFQQCRLLFSQLGLSGWEHRTQLNLLTKNERLLRELRNLDTQRCRETHKIAVIYAAPGQEDKNSILSNQGGSVAYEQFLASLAWEVELEGHTGFLGGLQRQGSTGLTAPYVSTSFFEAIFHVATRMPGDTPEAVLNKTRHLGNDEVHIVWSEHSRDYRRDIIPTEFCDILIVIYPLGNHLNRVTINCKPEVPNFGIIFHEAIIESNILAGVIRAAVICASRAKRSTLSFYQQYYEERSKSLETIISKHRDSSIYEDFISKVYSPVLASGPFCNAGTTTTGDDTSCSSNPSMLASALLDSHGHSHKGLHRGDHKFRASDGRGVWFNNNDISQNVESTSISPRPLKKLQTSFKTAPKRSAKQEPETETPPDTPVQLLRKK